MTAPVVTEIISPPEPASRDPFIDDVSPPPAPVVPVRRRIVD